VKALVRDLPAGSGVEIVEGCQEGPFFQSQEVAALAFLSQYLATS
jgi:hypothetical protein